MIQANICQHPHGSLCTEPSSTKRAQKWHFSNNWSM